MPVATRGDLKRHIAAEMGLDLTTGQLEDLLLNDWAQDSIYDFLIETRANLTQSTIALVPGQQDYDMASAVPNVLSATEMFLASGSGKYGLERASTAEIIERRRASTSLDRVRKYALEGDLLMVYPTPQSADSIILYGALKPSPFAADGNDFTIVTYGGIPVQHDTALLAYMRWRAAIYDERRLPHTPDQYRQFYGLELAKARKRMRRMGGRMNPPMAAGYPAVGSAGTRNDEYP